MIYGFVSLLSHEIGHEIIGHATKVGSEVTRVKVGKASLITFKI